MIDLHTHTFLSDGALIPSELARRAESIGIEAIALTDHVDESNYDLIVERLARFCDDWNDSSSSRIIAIPGAEITHAPVEKIGSLIERIRAAGAKLALVHGETIVEPVAAGTNRAAIDGRADILAHPGLISEEEASAAAENGVALEISARGGHSFTNGRVAAMARASGARLVLNSDAHEPRDLIDQAMARIVALGAGMSPSEIEKMFQHSRDIVARALKK